MLTQRVRVAESRIENSSANGPPRVRSKGWVLKRVLDEVGCNWRCSEDGCCGVQGGCCGVQGGCRGIRDGCCGVRGGCCEIPRDN